jgi:hypothetical protein
MPILFSLGLDPSTTLALVCESARPACHCSLWAPRRLRTCLGFISLSLLCSSFPPLSNGQHAVDVQPNRALLQFSNPSPRRLSLHFQAAPSRKLGLCIRHSSVPGHRRRSSVIYVRLVLRKATYIAQPKATAHTMIRMLRKISGTVWLRRMSVLRFRS